MSHNEAKDQRRGGTGNGRGPETAADAADGAGARGPQAAVDVHRHQHA